jgi:hypothetical protein
MAVEFQDPSGPQQQHLHDSFALNSSFVHNTSVATGCNASFRSTAPAAAAVEEAEEGDSRYMAPELLGAGGRGPPADIFSLGVSAFQLAWDLGEGGGRDLTLRWREKMGGGGCIQAQRTY